VTLHERCLAIVAVTEIESLQEKILSEFASLCSAQSGALWVSGERVGMRLRAWKGMIDRQALPDLVDPSLVQNHAWLSGTSLLGRVRRRPAREVRRVRRLLRHGVEDRRPLRAVAAPGPA
jgi:hypothetical protein